MERKMRYKRISKLPSEEIWISLKQKWECSGLIRTTWNGRENKICKDGAGKSTHREAHQKIPRRPEMAIENKTLKRVTATVETLRLFRLETHKKTCWLKNTNIHVQDWCATMMQHLNNYTQGLAKNKHGLQSGATRCLLYRCACARQAHK